MKNTIHCTCTVILITAVISVVFYYNSSCIDSSYFPSPPLPLPPAHLAPVPPAQRPPTGGVCVLPGSAVAVVWLPGALPGGDSGGSELHRRGSGTPHTHHLFTRCKCEWESLGRFCVYIYTCTMHALNGGGPGDKAIHMQYTCTCRCIYCTHTACT